MTSPITHENIIEVLHDFAREAEHYGDLRPDDSVATVLLSQLRRARDLYQRLQAEKEGGDAPSKIIAWARGVHSPSTPHGPAEYDLELCEGDDQPEGAGWFPLCRCPQLNQEGGDADAQRERPDIASPASGTDSSGRATLQQRLRIKADMITLGEKIEWGSDSAVMHEAAEALASEFDRGRRRGIEKAAKVAEDTDYHGKIPLGWALAVNTAADKIRALLTNPEKTT